MLAFLRRYRNTILAVIIFGAMFCSLAQTALIEEPTRDEILFYEVSRSLTIWLHPPLANLIVYPFVQLTDNIQLLRLIPITLTMLSLLLAFLIVRKRLSTSLALLSISPILLYRHVAAGGTFFWNEAFMLFFLMLTIYLSGRWKYVSACALVLSKIPATLYLIPIAMKNKDWKLLLPTLIFTPYLVATWISNGDPFYLLNLWLSAAPVVQPYWGSYIATNWLVLCSQTGLIVAPILALPGIQLLLKEKWLVVAIAISLLIGVGWAFLPYQLIEFMFLSLLAISFSIERLDSYYKERKK